MDNKLPTKSVLYSTSNQKAKFPLIIRFETREKDHFLSLLKESEKIVAVLLEGTDLSLVLIRALCQSLSINLVCIADYLSLLKATVGQSLDPYNQMYVKEAVSEALFRQVRNGLAHPTDGAGLVHVNTKIARQIAVPFYWLRGEDSLFCYPSPPKVKLESDFCFGCGFFRVSIILHVLPYLAESRARVERYNPLRKALNCSASIETLPDRKL